MYLDAEITGESFDSIYNEIEINFNEQHYETVIKLCDVVLDKILPSMEMTEKELNEKLLSIFYYKAESLVYIDEIEDSIEYYAKAIELAEILKDEESEIELTFTYLEVVIQNQLDREVHSYFQRISDLHNLRKDNTILTQWYALKAGYAFNCDQFEETIRFCQLYTRFRSSVDESIYDLEVATLHIRSQNALGNISEAINLSEQALKEFELLLRTEKYCELLINHGLLQYNNHQADKAIGTLQQAYQISDEESYALCALNALYTVGFIYFSNEQFEDSLQIGSIFLARKDADLITELLAEVIVFVGVSLMKLEKYSECTTFIDHHLSNQESSYYFSVVDKLTMIQQMISNQTRLLD